MIFQRICSAIQHECSNHHQKLFFSSVVVKNYDIVISGGGVVGAAVLTGLLQKFGDNIKIALIDIKNPDLMSKNISNQNENPPDARVYALSPSSLTLLKELDIWKYIHQRTQPYTSMQIWESNSYGFFRFNAKHMSIPELGTIVEDQNIQNAFYKLLNEQNIQFDQYYDSSITAINLQKTHVTSTSTPPLEVSITHKDMTKTVIKTK